uniref:Uncharacterized protein n=1 Tax=mine drainage metagenome TaxID=410659 RepID=E6PQD7_9ZZZZ
MEPSIEAWDNAGLGDFLVHALRGEMRP